jgi:hypothetical protein
MTKPNDIPFEVWTAAERFLADWERPRPAGFVMELEDWIDQLARAMMLARSPWWEQTISFSECGPSRPHLMEAVRPVVKPDGIPDDILDVALALVGEWGWIDECWPEHSNVVRVARALMAEREAGPERLP